MVKPKTSLNIGSSGQGTQPQIIPEFQVYMKRLEEQLLQHLQRIQTQQAQVDQQTQQNQQILHKNLRSLENRIETREKEFKEIEKRIQDHMVSQKSSTSQTSESEPLPPEPSLSAATSASVGPSPRQQPVEEEATLTIELRQQLASINQQLMSMQETTPRGEKSNMPGVQQCACKQQQKPSSQVTGNVEEAIRTLAPDGHYIGASSSHGGSRQLESTKLPGSRDHDTLGDSGGSNGSVAGGCNDSSVLQDLGTLLTARLPPDTDKFNGDLRKYEKFKLKFCTLLSGYSFTTPKDRATSLYKALTDDVIDNLDHIPDLDRPDAYERMWRSLDFEYGRFQYGVFSHVTELQSIQRWPVCENSADLYNLYKFVKSHYKSLEQASQEIQAETIKVALLGKLKGRALGKCSTLIKESGERPVVKKMLQVMREEVDTLELQEMARGDEGKTHQSGKNCIKGAVNLVNATDEACLSDPVNFVNAGPTRNNHQRVQFTDKPPLVLRSPTRSRQGETNTRSPTRGQGQQTVYDREFTEEMERRFSKKCIFCISDEHTSHQCTALEGPEEYRNILYKFRLCFNCHGQGHSYRHCFRPKYCTKSCNNSEKHSNVVCNQRS